MICIVLYVDYGCMYYIKYWFDIYMSLMCLEVMFGDVPAATQRHIPPKLGILGDLVVNL